MEFRNTYLGSWAKCPQRYFLECVEGLLPSPSAAMTVGGMTHAGLRDLYAPGRSRSYWDEEREEREPTDDVLLEAERLVMGYKNRYFRNDVDEDWQILAAELPISFPVFSPTLPIHYAGTADLLIRRTTAAGTQLWVPDHKTSAALSSSVILHYLYSPQLQGYIAAIQKGITEPIEGACVNLIVKTKTVQFHREYAPINHLWMEQWEAAMKSMVSQIVTATLDYYILDKKAVEAFPQNRYECVPYFGSECPFRLVCWHSNGRLTPTIKSTYRENKKRITYEQALELHEHSRKEVVDEKNSVG